ncbi:fibrinogen-like protein 1 [Asterias rubens]|uniref:fibrinogen-like protein 1 n=1 Tax=Asterias rubens TaxID=7604 RepID=UPI00145528C0|nr:fibrinogen-like protein 1 [Asterias rubens]
MGLLIRSLLVVLIVKSQVELQVEASSNQRTVSCDVDTSSKVAELRLIVENYLVILEDELRNTQDQVKELKVLMTETVSSELEDTRRTMAAISTIQETATSEHEETRRMVSELQVAVSTNQETATSEQEETRRMVSELQVAVSTNQETATSEQEETRRMVSELQAAVSTNQETATSEQEETRRMVSELQTAARRTMAAISTNQETATSEQEETRRMVSELQTAVSTNQQKVTVALRNTTLQLKDTRREMGVIGRQVEELQESVSRLTKIHGVRDCSDVLARGEARSGVYAAKPDSGRPFKVYCDMETDGGGWTVFQRRQDGSVDFYLDFANYSRGFGNLEGEFWLGNDNLHRLTAQGEYELRVDLTSFDDDTGFALYESFGIADVSDNYRLTVGSYNGTAGDWLAYHNNQAFTTKDRDNDLWSSGNCAQDRHGAWWYYSCAASNLNGRYFNWATTNNEGIRWNGFSASRSLKTTEMKIRRKV